MAKRRQIAATLPPMPMPSKGTRRRLTIRVPIDVYVESARQAAARGWTMTGYAAFAMAEQTKRDRHNRPPGRRGMPLPPGDEIDGNASFGTVSRG